MFKARALMDGAGGICDKGTVIIVDGDIFRETTGDKTSTEFVWNERWLGNSFEIVSSDEATGLMQKAEEYPSNVVIETAGQINPREGFVTKDSGVREEFTSGMVRDTQKGKPRYDLIDRAFLKGWAELMGRGADKYGPENWRKATGEEELKRFKASALRHMYQWLDGDKTENHSAAVAFNLAGAEFVEAKMKAEYCNQCGVTKGECGA